jgi:hypothetical protein
VKPDLSKQYCICPCKKFLLQTALTASIQSIENPYNLMLSMMAKTLSAVIRRWSTAGRSPAGEAMSEERRGDDISDACKSESERSDDDGCRIGIRIRGICNEGARIIEPGACSAMTCSSADGTAVKAEARALECKAGARGMSKV